MSARHYLIHSTNREEHPRFGCILARGWWRVDVQAGVHRHPRGPFRTEDKGNRAERPNFVRPEEASAPAAG